MLERKGELLDNIVKRELLLAEYTAKLKEVNKPVENFRENIDSWYNKYDKLECFKETKGEFKS